MTSLFTPSPSPTVPPLPADLRLTDILKTIPRECFQKDMTKAWTMVLVNMGLVALGYLGLVVSPWYLLPLLWVFTGTALTGFFVIGHDCAHRSFSNRIWVNDLVGHVFMLPLIYPFHSWRILHDFHHLHTNKVDVDNAWQPFKPDYYESLNPLVRFGYHLIRGRFWWVGSIAHWAMLHFDWNKFEGKERERVRFSALLVIGFAAIAFPTLILTTGVWGFVKFWLLPWLVYHFWMSTFTLVHHTMPDIPFLPESEWNAAHAQLTGTVHCEYPWWVEFMCHHINVHVPHHVSTGIPAYRLRMAYESLKENWGDYLYECNFSWALMKKITDECHLYHPEKLYQSFQEYRSSKA